MGIGCRPLRQNGMSTFFRTTVKKCRVKKCQDEAFFLISILEFCVKITFN